MNGLGERAKDLGGDADILETDMLQADRLDQFEQVEAILDRAIVARQHEDKIHLASPVPLRVSRLACRSVIAVDQYLQGYTLLFATPHIL